MRCMSTVSYAININGRPRGRIVPSRGIRQGDPLSPYLFLLCAGLSALIKSLVESGSLEGLVVSRGGPKLSHLFFADDSLIKPISLSLSLCDFDFLCDFDRPTN